MTTTRATPVITGVGVVSGFGRGIDALWNGLAANQVAVRLIESFPASAFKTQVAAEARGIDSRFRDVKVDLALAAAEDAWRQAGCESASGVATSIALGLERAHLEDLAVVFDSGHINWSREREQLTPSPRLRTPLDTASREVRRALGFDGRNAVHVSACAAGALAVALAAKWIERGMAEVVVCGGSDSMVNPLGVGGMTRLGAPSPRNEPSACRPFDRDRDGLVIGEAAAMFVVESKQRALARGARLLAQIAGSASSQDAYKATAPRPDGSSAVIAMTRALESARLTPRDIDWINAHGTGTPLGDPAEAQAIAAVFDNRPPVSSIKGAIGHCMAAAGAVEIAAGLAALAKGAIPPSANLQTVDDACLPEALDHVRETRPATLGAILSNSFGFGGQNASIVLTHPEWSGR